MSHIKDMDALWFPKICRKLSTSLCSNQWSLHTKIVLNVYFGHQSRWGHEKRIRYIIDDIGWPCLSCELRAASDSYTDIRFLFLATESLPTLKYFLKSVTGHRFIFNLGPVKCFHWPVWEVSSSLPVLAVVRAAINTSQLLGIMINMDY